MEQAVVMVEDIASSYGRNKVLKGTTLHASKKEMVGIVGENGSGKTTLLKVLVGLLKPDRGSIKMHGCLGYCPQDPLVFNRLTVQENLRYFARAYGLKQLGRADELLDVLQFERYRHTLSAELSSGTRQKLNLTIALMHDPDILILDEPYNGFDWETYLRFWGLAEAFLESDKSIIVVSHLVFDRHRFDRIYSLQEGVLQCV